MAFTVTCPTCGVRLTLEEDRAGQKFVCPKCDGAMMLPGAEPQPVSRTNAPEQPPPLPPEFVPPPVLMPTKSSRYDARDEVEEDDEPPRRSKRRRSSRDDYGFRCPFCNSDRRPIRQEKISTGGWVTFAILLAFCPLLFWIGLLIKEEYMQCRDCGAPIGN